MSGKRIPEEVPRHYNAAGEVDGWGQKSGLFMLPAVVAGLRILLIGLGNQTRIMNTPFSADRDASPVKKTLRELMSAMKAATTLVPPLAYLVRLARHRR